MERSDVVRVYRAGDGWRWHRYDGNNGLELSQSSEGYEHHQHAREQAVELNPGCRIEDEASDPEADV